MNTRCKFSCTSKRQYKGWGGHPFLYEYAFNAVTDGSDDNKKFFAATPSGTLNVSTVLDGSFEVGQEYYLDLSLAVVPATA